MRNQGCCVAWNARSELCLDTHLPEKAILRMRPRKIRRILPFWATTCRRPHPRPPDVDPRRRGFADNHSRRARMKRGSVAVTAAATARALGGAHLSLGKARPSPEVMECSGHGSTGAIPELPMSPTHGSCMQSSVSEQRPLSSPPHHIPVA
jgi:hypothetical protein